MSEHHSNPTDDRTLAERMRSYGCPDLIPLDGRRWDKPEQIECLDLLPHGRSRARLAAVVEHQGTALLYLLDGCGEVTADVASKSSRSRQISSASGAARQSSRIRSLSAR